MSFDKDSLNIIIAMAIETLVTSGCIEEVICSIDRDVNSKALDFDASDFDVCHNPMMTDVERPGLSLSSCLTLSSSKKTQAFYTYEMVSIASKFT